MREYVYERLATGALSLTDGNWSVSQVPPTENFAIFFDEDVLLKHGSAEFVRKEEDRIRRQMKALGDPELLEGFKVLEVPVKDITDDILIEINKCLTHSGYVGKLEERLAELTSSSAPSA